MSRDTRGCSPSGGALRVRRPQDVRDATGATPRDTPADAARTRRRAALQRDVMRRRGATSAALHGAPGCGAPPFASVSQDVRVDAIGRVARRREWIGGTRARRRATRPTASREASCDGVDIRDVWSASRSVVADAVRRLAGHPQRCRRADVGQGRAYVEARTGSSGCRSRPRTRELVWRMEIGRSSLEQLLDLDNDAVALATLWSAARAVSCRAAPRRGPRNSSQSAPHAL